MKLARIILICSLIANLALGAAYLTTGRRSSATTSTESSSNKTEVPTSAEKWLLLEKGTSDDDPAFVARLRAEGFPPSVIRAIVTARVAEHFAARRGELTQAAGKLPYWRRLYTFTPNNNPSARAALRQLQREQSACLRQLLGDDATPEYLRTAIALRTGGLSVEKTEQLDWIKRDYAELNTLLQDETGGLYMEEDRAKFELLEKEQQADLAALLTPAELEAYELRSSPTAIKIKRELDLFDLTETEFLGLYRLRKTFDKSFGRASDFLNIRLSQDELKKRQKAEQQLQQDIKAALGPERYADYQMVTDSDYRNIHQLTESLNLPPSTAKTIYQIGQESATRADALRRDFANDAQKLAVEQERLNQEKLTKLNNLLGVEGVKALRKASLTWRSLPADQSK